MSNKVQTEKNIDLTHKLLQYLFNAGKLPKLPEDVSFVPFSNKNAALNRQNEELLASLSKEEKPVVKAQEPTSIKGAWKFTPVNF
jgi:hypothetical protein